jgi:DNA-binding transcriptional LysR family regulator
MADSNEMGIFQRVIERGSFAGAADDMGLSPSAVSNSWSPTGLST